MDTISYSAFRSQSASILDKVNDDHKPILITRQNGKPAVVMGLEDFQAYEETALDGKPESSLFTVRTDSKTENCHDQLASR